VLAASEELMGTDANTKLRAVGNDIYLELGTAHWRLSFSSARRVASDWFVHVDAFGPRACAFTVRLRTRPDNAESALRIVHVISDWLRSGDDRAHVFLDGAPDAAAPVPPHDACARPDSSG
jgi:hypothetical protein